MKKVKNVVSTIVTVILVVILAAILIFRLAGNQMIKTGIETAGKKALNVGVSVDSVKLSLLQGKIDLAGVVVKNPEGYQFTDLLKLGSATVKVNAGSLFSDTIEIQNVMLDNMEIVIEQKGLTNNLHTVLDSLPRPDEKAESAKPGKKVVVDLLEITNAKVNAKLLPIPGKADTVSFTLDKIEMKDLGGDKKINIADLMAKIFSEISKSIAGKGAGVLPDDITGGLKNVLSGELLGEKGKAAAEAVQEATKSVEGVKEGLKGLFEKKK